ncbi:MAG TPA: DUF1549 domain-containing protein [Verrucomicrobiales bacterium]|nr:DUF1549 domain-containing protein [Verrucomicrobiales bacterium]
MRTLRSFRLIAPAFFLLSCSARGAVDFAHDVVPVLKQHCAECHLGGKKKGGLSMNTRADLLAGSENGKVAVPGKPDESLLLKLLTSTDKDEQMPPKGERVPASKIEVLRTWIAEGLVWEEGFSFGNSGWEPPLKPRRVELPPATDGREHPVDRIIDRYLTEHKVSRPQPVGDAAFARRLSLDVIGLLPDPEEVTAFAAEGTSDKRAQLIAKTLARDVEYTEHWLSFWNDLLRNDYQGTGYIDGGRKQITGWLYQALLNNKPYNQFAGELLAPPSDQSAGFINGIQWRGSVNASQVREIQFSQSISQVFLGINMKCASCHDSFIDRWKLDDAYALAAIYSDKPLEIYRCDKATGRKAQAGWIFPELGSIDTAAPQKERLKQLAGLMTHPDNGRFTRTLVNRIWHRLMGRGIVHPVDAMHTEPWSADLLDWLSVWFMENKYDVKKLIAFIAASQAYQSRTVAGPEETETKYVYKGPVARRLTAEQFVDAVWRLTGSAPGASNGSVIRGRPAPAEKLTGKWIWSRADASSSAPAGETVVFRRSVTLPAASSGGRAVVSCDNSCQVLVDGKRFLKHDNWESPGGINLPKMKAGEHVFTIVAKNGGSGPNPAGLFFEARIQQNGGSPLTLASDAAWTWAAEDKPDAEWKAAAEVANQSVWAKVSDALRAGVSQNTGGGPVRASVVASDLLMRALGRPNREQIVSMRPDNLNTLEAIDLANGGILAGLLKKGAAQILASWKGTPQELAADLCRRALTRPPTQEEARLLSDTLGSSPNAQSVEDVLWMILMLPEFQFVR